MDIDDISDLSEKVDILFIAANARSLVHNRGDFIRGLLGQGYKVAALVPRYDYSDEVGSLKINIIKYDLDRHSLNPIKFIHQFFALFNIVRKIAPAAVFCYAVKPIILGSLAARMSGVKNIFCLVTGLGYAFCADGLKPLFIRQISRMLYGFSSLVSTVFIFQNEYDKKELEHGWLFKISGMLGKEKLVVPGSGVDVDYYKAYEIDPTSFSFFCMARLIKEKGVYEYASAAKIVKEKFPDARFYLAGELDENLVSSVKNKEVEEWQRENGIEYLGKISNVKDVMKKSTFFVLPSYREGTSRAILEAMSMGRPIITTDVPGCNGPVLNDVNGFVVKPRDSKALAEAMIEAIKSKGKINDMALASRSRAVEVYDVNKVNALMLEAINKHLK